MADGVTIVAGLPIPSTSPVFLAVIGMHVAFGLTCIITGAGAMLSRKGRGRHSDFGSIYFWGLVVIFPSSAGLAISRWAEDWPLFVLGSLAMACAGFGRNAMRRRRPAFVRLHIAGMSASYVVLLTAFLCRQRQKPAALARFAADRVLAAAGRRRRADHRLGAAVPSARAALACSM